MLAELVWYRMLAPLLGGTSYTLGLILAVALAGIGIGGALYSFGTRRATLGRFALTCALEAFAIALPFALGDRLAIFALYLGPLAHGTFFTAIIAWSLITVVVVFPAAVVAGYQFPVLIALYGEGEKDVGSDVGRAYVANTAGSIVGSLAGGFGLLPSLTAPGCWKLVTILLAITAALAIALDAKLRRRGSLVPATTGGAIAIAAVVCLSARGPTATWRHSGIGAGRATAGDMSRENIADFSQHYNSALAWEMDGIESSVALSRGRGYSFIVNGKTDGHVIADRATQVMSGLLGALVHGHVKSALIVGLGTGSTAGWLASDLAIERVDVMELEPAILRVARDCKAVNQDVLSNAHVHVTLGDAREALLTSRTSYDLVFSEPSNPYRAGISSLYTLEYYRAVTQRLADDGVFIQWIQTYDVDPFTVGTAMITLRQAFPSVMVWEPAPGDLLLIGQKSVRPIDLDRMRAMLEREPYRTALQVAWDTNSLEGLFAHFVAAPAFANIVVANDLGVVNRDDENALEFAFARQVGSHQHVEGDVARLARRLRVDRPLTTGALDEERVEEERMLARALVSAPIELPAAHATPALKTMAAALRHFTGGQYAAGLASWTQLDRPPRSYYETVLVATAMAVTGDARLPAILPLMSRPTERALAEGIWLVKTNQVPEGAEALARGFVSARTDPWISQILLDHADGSTRAVAATSPALAKKLTAALLEPFAAEVARSTRLSTLIDIARRTGDPRDCVVAFDRAEPIPFERAYIEGRVACYEVAADPRLPAARAELQRLLSYEPVFGVGIPTPASSPPPRAPEGGR
jgi:predicted membrane-bound spermidine synthase